MKLILVAFISTLLFMAFLVLALVVIGGMKLNTQSRTGDWNATKALYQCLPATPGADNEYWICRHKEVQQ